MPYNDNMVPEMRASLDRMTAYMSGESKDELVRDYSYAVSLGKPASALNEAEKHAVEAYIKNLQFQERD